MGSIHVLEDHTRHLNFWLWNNCFYIYCRGEACSFSISTQDKTNTSTSHRRYLRCVGKVLLYAPAQLHSRININLKEKTNSKKPAAGDCSRFYHYLFSSIFSIAAAFTQRQRISTARVRSSKEGYVGAIRRWRSRGSFP